MCKSFIWVLILMTLPGLHTVADEDDLLLSVTITGVQANEGQVMLSLFTGEANFLKEPFIDEVLPAGDGKAVHFELSGLAKGTYAISVFYDQDGDGKLKKGFMGIPKELVGFSNNAKGTFGPPSFEESSFILKEDTSIVINLGKARD